MNDQLDSKTEAVETLEPIEKRIGPGWPATRGGGSHPVAEAKPPRTPKPEPARRTAFDDNDEEDDTFIGRHKAKLALVVVLVVGGAMAYLISHRGETPIRKAPERVVMIQPLPPPPPPPPPPPKVEPPPKMEEKMVEQAPVEDEPKPEPKPADDPPPLGTGIKGDGPPDGFGLGSSGNGGGFGGTGLGNGRGGGKWDGFARQVQSSVANALRRNPKTRAAQISNLQIRIWPDSTGRITRAKLARSTGDAALDAAIENEVLTGLQLQEPPPQGMPSPIVLRYSARRPN